MILKDAYLKEKIKSFDVENSGTNAKSSISDLSTSTHLSNSTQSYYNQHLKQDQLAKHNIVITYCSISLQ